jgi:hypothetical protein
MPASRRRSQRARHDSVLELLHMSGDPLPGTLRLVDVSDHGVSFTTTEELPQGALLRGRLRTLKGGPQLFSGRIVRRQIRGSAILYGLDFEGRVPLPPEDLRLGGTD